MFHPLVLYDGFRKSIMFVSFVTGPVLLFVDAPFGRFSPKRDTIFTLDGINSWIVMECVSPIVFLTFFISSPFSASSSTPKSLPQLLLATFFLVHYANRAIINPLRTPSRSKSHLIVPLIGIAFNIVNGFLLGSYLSSKSTHDFLSSAFDRPIFWVGSALWALGFAGNILHDEILLNLRRNAQKKKKESKQSSNGHTGPKEHYGIPHGWLYEYISYPNYFCEWIEWAGFALAAGPVAVPTVSSIVNGFMAVFDWSSPVALYAPFMTPPWLFLWWEIAVMFPRAYKGHLWYKSHFGDRYPSKRKIAFPGIL